MKSLCLAVMLAAFFLAMYAPPLSEAGWTCSNKGPCHCKDSNFSIEIESVVNEFFLEKNISDSEGKYSFLVSPCKPISCNLTNPNEDKTASACQFIIDQNPTKLGEVDQYSWNVENSTSFSITYKGGKSISESKSRQTRFDFTVAKVDKATIDYVEESVDKPTNVHTYVFAATISPSEENQGGGSPSKAGAIGLVIIVLLLLGLLLYFIIGSIVMFQVKGARGSEVIPNQGFWKELPFLIRDGCKFTVSPCLKLSGMGYQSL